MANGGGQIGGTVQSAVGSFGPIGSAISGVSTAATGKLDQSDSPIAGGVASGIFNPSRNLDFATNKENPLGQRALSLFVNPAFAGFFDKKNAEKKRGVSREDPRQTERLLELDRIAKNIQAGTDSATQTAIQAGQENVAQTQSRLARVTGGQSGATVDAFLKAQGAGQQGVNQALAQGQGRQAFFANLGQTLQNRISQRSLELDLLGNAQISAEQAQATKEANINRQGALGTAISTGAFDTLGDTILNAGSLFGGGKAPTGPGGNDLAGLVNPNEGLDQTLIQKQNLNPSVDLGGGIESGNPISGLQGTSFFN